MKFEDVHGRCHGRALSRLAAAEELGKSERTVRRFLQHHDADGAEGLYERRLSRASARPAGFDEVVAPVQALMQAVPEEKALGSMSLLLEPGMSLEQEGLSNWLVEAGYARVDVVEEPGDFALRGGLVDVYPPGNLPAVRGDEAPFWLDRLIRLRIQSHDARNFAIPRQSRHGSQPPGRLGRG